MNSASENSRLTNRNDQSCFSTRAFCAILLYSPREPSCWPHPWMVSSTGPGSVLLVAPMRVSSSSLPTPRFFFHLSFPPSCLLLFMKGSETPNFRRQRSLALSYLLLCHCSSSLSKERCSISYKRVLDQVIFPKQK